MDLKHKHLAVISAGALVAIFLGLAVWYMASHPAPVAIAPGVATTTPTEPTPTDKTIIDLKKYYEIRAKYPLAVPTQDGGVSAQKTMEAWVTDQIATFKSDSKLDSLTAEDIKMQSLVPPDSASVNGTDEGRKYALTIAYTPYTSNATISYSYEIFSDTLGAHPNTHYRTFTFDKQTGSLVELSTLFNPNSSYLDLLSKRTRADLPVIIDKQSNGGADTSDIAYGTAPKVESFQNFYIENGNLVIVFAPYQVGPYALGTVLDPIPLSSLKDSLNPKYLR